MLWDFATAILKLRTRCGITPIRILEKFNFKKRIRSRDRKTVGVFFDGD